MRKQIERRATELEEKNSWADDMPDIIMLVGISPKTHKSVCAQVMGGDRIEREPGESVEQFGRREDAMGLAHKKRTAAGPAGWHPN